MGLWSDISGGRSPLLCHFFPWASLVAQSVKHLPAMWETWVRSLGRKDTPGEGNGNPLQHSCLENLMGRGAWWATVYRITKSRTRLSDSRFLLFLVSGTWLQLVPGLSVHTHHTQPIHTPGLPGALPPPPHTHTHTHTGEGMCSVLKSEVCLLGEEVCEPRARLRASQAPGGWTPGVGLVLAQPGRGL